MKTQEQKLVTKIGLATPNKGLKGWVKDTQYEVNVSKMSTGKHCIYKDMRHFKEASGYLVYPDLQSIQKDFALENVTIRV